MGKTLDFTRHKKSFLTVKIDDEQKTVLFVNTPTKEIYEEMFDCFELLEGVQNAQKLSEVRDSLDAIYRTCAKALSHNKQRKHFTDHELEAIWDVEDVILFFTEYMDFVAGEADGKN